METTGDIQHSFISQIQNLRHMKKLRKSIHSCFVFVCVCVCVTLCVVSNVFSFFSRRGGEINSSCFHECLGCYYHHKYNMYVWPSHWYSQRLWYVDNLSSLTPSCFPNCHPPTPPLHPQAPHQIVLPHQFHL